jgi:molybdopterin converting factor small subunit
LPEVWIPALLRDLTGGQQKISVPGDTVRQVIENLEASYPGVKERLLDGDRLRPSIAVAVDGEISALKLRHRLAESSEVHFLPAISGG